MKLSFFEELINCQLDVGKIIIKKVVMFMANLMWSKHFIKL